MYRDDSAHTPEPHHPLVSETHHPGDALMVQDDGANHKAHPLAIPSPIQQPTQDVLRGGMDANTFIHALRRRWLLALCMGLVIGGGGAPGLLGWFFRTFSAAGLVLGRHEKKAVLH